MNEKIATQDLLLNIATAEGAVLARFEEAKKQIKELRAALPDLYAKSFLREITNGELCEAKRQIAIYQEVIDTTPVMLDGLARRKENLEKAKKAEHRRERKVKALQDYEALKAEIATMNQYDQGVEARLSALAGDCRRRGEAEEVVKAWKQSVEGTPAQCLEVS